MARWNSIVCALLLMAALFASCEPSQLTDSAAVRLEMSADTVAFDTVFTTLGTTTRRLTVYNRSEYDLRLSWVGLASGGEGAFRLNVDGDTAVRATDVEILSGDSIFIFAQATVNPNDATQPFLVEDAILFSNGQRVPLAAWGRNAVYHKLLPTDTTWYTVIDVHAWDHTRPHVILDPAAVLDGDDLVLQAGDELHFGPDAMLVFDTNARLLATGTAEQPVLFTSLRKDGWYTFLPGQWQCLLFTGGSRGNRVEHAVVENGTGGLRVYPDAELTVQNTVIRNMSDCALIGQGGELTGRNLLVYDCFAALTVLRGGRYEMQQCTFADYWNYSSRTMPAVVLSNFLHMQDGVQADDLRASFSRCIIYGSYAPAEVATQTDSLHLLEVQYEQCHIKGMDGAEDPLFEDVQKDDYHLRADSPAAGLGYNFDM